MSTLQERQDKRSYKLKEAARLFIKGTHTGERITSIPKLARLTGANEHYLRKVKVRDKWLEQAEEFATRAQAPVIPADDTLDHLFKVRETARRKSQEALELWESCETGTKEDDRAREAWSKCWAIYARMSGIDAMIDADKVRKVEAAKLQAKADAKAKAREADDDKGDSGGLITV